MTQSKWSSLDDRGKIRALIQENAYFIWERRVKTNKPGTPEEDWKAAEEYVLGPDGWRYLAERPGMVPKKVVAIAS